MYNHNHSNLRVMTIREVSEYLKIPLSTLYELVKKGKIRGVKIGRHWRFLEEDILHYLRNGCHPSDGQHPETNFREMERRQHPRINAESSAKLTVHLSSQSGIGKEGMIRNFSEGGMIFVYTESQANTEESGTHGPKAKPGVGDPIKISFEVPGKTPRSVELEGRVIHRFTNGKIAVGIKFRNISEEDRGAIRNYVG